MYVSMCKVSKELGGKGKKIEDIMKKSRFKCNCWTIYMFLWFYWTLYYVLMIYSSPYIRFWSVNKFASNMIDELINKIEVDFAHGPSSQGFCCFSSFLTKNSHLSVSFDLCSKGWWIFSGLLANFGWYLELFHNNNFEVCWSGHQTLGDYAG